MNYRLFLIDSSDKHNCLRRQSKLFVCLFPAVTVKTHGMRVEVRASDYSVNKRVAVMQYFICKINLLM